MPKKTHLKVRLVPEKNPDSKFIYYAKKPTKGEKVKDKLKDIYGKDYFDDVISKCDRVLSGLVVDRDRMRKNIDDQKGLIMAEKVMLELVNRGMPRDSAHEELRSASMGAVESGSNLEEICRNSQGIMKLFEEEEVADLFAPESHLGSSEEIVANSVSMARQLCSEY